MTPEVIHKYSLKFKIKFFGTANFKKLCMTRVLQSRRTELSAGDQWLKIPFNLQNNFTEKLEAFSVPISAVTQ